MTLRIITLASIICTGVPASRFAQSNFGMAVANRDDEVHLVGSWRVTQCPGPHEFFVLMAFNAGGTAFHTDQSSGVGNTGAGVWSGVRGRGNFAATFEEFQDTDSDGNADSRFLFRATIHLNRVARTWDHHTKRAT